MTVEVVKAEVATVSHQEEKMKVVDEVVEVLEVKKDVEEAKPESVEKISSFKEESNFVSDLKDYEKKALSDLKAKLEEAILGNSLFKKDEVTVEEKKEECVKEEVKVEEVKAKEVEKVEGEESSKKSGEKKGFNKLKSTIQEAFKGHSLFKKDEVKVEEVEEKAKVEEDCVKEEVEKVEDVEVKESEKVEEKEKCAEGGEESSKKSGEKKGLNKLKSTIQEAFRGHSLFKKDEVKVEEVVEEKAKVEEEKKEDDCVKEEVEKVEEAVEVKEVEKVEEKEKCVEGGEESSKKSVEKKGLNKLKSKIGEAFKGHSLFKKDEPKIEEVVEEKPKVEEEKKGEKEGEKKEECEEEVVQEDVKEKESETVEEKVEEGEESSKKSVEKKGLNIFKSTIQEAFKGHLFSKKSKKVEEKKEELKPEGADMVEEEAKPESCEKVEEESKPECEEKVEEKQEEAAVEVIKTEVCEVKEPEAVVEEVVEEIKTEECEEEKKVEEVVEVCEEEKKVEEVVEVCEEEKKVEEVVEVCEEEKKVEEVVVVDKDISLWGVPLLPSKADEGTDVVLLKFLRARDFKVSEAFKMLKKTLEWRKELKIDSILDEDMGNDLSMAAYMSGVDREGHPICYNIFGVLDDEELYQKTLGSEEKRDSFLRWRFQLMERGIQKLEFKPTGVTSLLQINDLKNSPGPAKKEVRIAIKQALGLLQDNYPEFLARNIFINVPFWYYAYKSVFSTSLTQRSKSKLVLARPAKVTETLLKYIPIEEIPIQYGGLKRDNDFEFSTEDCIASELIIKATSTATIEIPAPQAGTTFIWDITVLGWDVNYKEEFVPTDECSYTIIVQKEKKLGSIEGPIRNTFRTTEPGKILLTIENCSNKKNKVFYRHKVKKSAF